MTTRVRKFRFVEPPDEERLVAALIAEVGIDRASEVDFDRRPGEIQFESMDSIALEYASKVCVVMGGVVVYPSQWKLPPWTATKWVDRPWWARLLRVWLGIA